MTDNLPCREDVHPIRRYQPVAAGLLLHTERELLEERMMRIRPHGENADTTCLMRSAKGAGQRWTAGCKTSPRREARTETWRSGHKGRGAGRAGKLRNRQSAVVLDKLLSASF